MTYDKILKNILELKGLIKEKKIFVFGTGKGGILTGAILDGLGFKEFCYLDNNSSKWGAELLGKSICSPDKLKVESPQKIIILIASNFFADISIQLENIGFRNKQHFFSVINLNSSICNNFNYSRILNAVIKICGAGTTYIEETADSFELADKLCRAGFPSYLMPIDNIASSVKLNADSKPSIILFYNKDKAELDLLLKELEFRDSKLSLVIITNCTKDQRTLLEEKVFQQGFRKHPLYMTINNYDDFDYNGRNILLVFEREDLKQRVKDISTISNHLSEGHIFAYSEILKFIKTNDDVIELNSGTGYGSYIIWAGSQARSIVGITDDDANLLNNRFIKTTNQIYFQNSLKADSNSIDFVIDINRILEFCEVQKITKEYKDILRPGGRMVISVQANIPKDIFTETNFDGFYLEQLYVQKYGDKDNNRFWREAKECETDFDRFIAVYMKSPLSSIPYKEKLLWSGSDYPKSHNHNYGDVYTYPWIQHSFVTMGFRAQSNELIAMLARDIMENAEQGSADFGAALCVSAYRVLEKDKNLEKSDYDLIESIKKYIEFIPKNPMQHRWHISCCYVLGELNMKTGNWEQAKRYYIKCAEADFLAYSPNLANKCLNACLKLANIFYGEGDQEGAIYWWTSCLNNGIKALEAGWDKWIGDFKEPLIYCFKEAEFIIDLMSQACYALWLVENNMLDRPAAFEKMMFFSTQFRLRV